MRAPCRSRRVFIQRTLLVCMWLIASLLPHVSLAQTASTLNVTVTPLYDGNFIQDTWLPLRITLQNGGGDRHVRVQANTSGDSTTYAQEVDLPGGASKDITLYLLPTNGSDTIDVAVREGDQQLASAATQVRLRSGERMVAIVANEPPQIALPRRQDLQTLPIAPYDMTIAQLPDRSLGLTTLSAIVLHDVDTNSLNEAQRQALLIWVAGGGQLVLSGGPASATTVAGLPETLRPAEIGETQNDLPGDVLATFAAFTDTLPSGLSGFQLIPQAGSQVVVGSDRPLVVERVFGRGRVQQLAFAVDSASLASWPGATRFWDLFLRPRNPDAAVTGPPGARLDDARALTLTASLGNLPALDLPSGLPLLVLLLIYFVVIGPAIHLVLRRLGRQNLGWIVIPATTLVFGIITFGLGFAFRASDVLLNQVSIVENFGSTANVRTLLGFYSANPRNFQATFPADTISRPLRSSNGPYGVVDGSPGTYGQGENATATIDSSAWAVQGLQAEAQVPFPAIDSEISINGSTISVRVTNPLDQTMRDVAVRYGQQVVFLGDIPSGKQAESKWLDPQTVETNGLPSSGDTLGVILFRSALEAGRQPGAIPDRTVVLRQNMVDSLLSNGPLPQSPGPTLVAWLDNSPLAATVTSSASIVERRTTLLLGRPAINAATGPIQLGRGWLNLDFANSGSGSICSSADGSVGIPVSSNPLSLVLSLPPELGRLQASKLTLTLESLRPWPNAGVQTALYNWDTGSWDEQNFDGPGDLIVDQPAQYLRGGRVLVQLGGRIVEANCLTARGTVEGTLP